MPTVRPDDQDDDSTYEDAGKKAVNIGIDIATKVLLPSGAKKVVTGTKLGLKTSAHFHEDAG